MASAELRGTAGCVCPGSYDPVTRGHLDIIRRAAGLFGPVYVGLLNNTAKSCMFSLEERRQMLQGAVRGIPGAQVVCWDGLLVTLLDHLGVDTVVRGVRGGEDLTSEEQMAVINSRLRPGTETVWLPSAPAWRQVSSSVVRELIRFGAEIAPFVPDTVADFVAAMDLPGAGK